MSKILIVDDSDTIRSVLASAVRAMKFEPLLADCGEKALELFAADRPALVLLDVNMPGIDGYETARRIRTLAPEELAHSCKRVVEVAQRELAALAIAHAASTTSDLVTFSAGIATYVPARDKVSRDLTARADEALYRAKQLGRNRSISV